nr:putative ribonuclease H-like domain-containing protein [Tanacetum cinerariifolium]
MIQRSVNNLETVRKSSFVDLSQYPDDPDMPALEDIVYSDNEEDGHTQEEGIEYEEVFAPVARIEAIRLFLAYASFMGFMVYQMDVKSVFLYETIEEEVYICQSPGFEDPGFLDKVYKVVKALYGLHQAPKAWYETLDNYLLENSFQRGKIDQTLFIKKQKGDILLVQVYVDDIIFGSTNKELRKAFEKLIKDKFQMSSMGELTFFLGLQVKQKDDGIFINGKSASTPIDTEKPLLKDPDGEDMDVRIYTVVPWPRLSSVLPQVESLMFLNDLSSHTTKYTSLALTPKVFANMRRIGKGFSGIETPLFATMLVQPRVAKEEEDEEDEVHAALTPPLLTHKPSPPPHEPIPTPPQAQPAPPSSLPQEQPTTTSASDMTLLNTLMETCNTLSHKVAASEQDKVAQALEIIKLKKGLRRIIKAIDADEDITLVDMETEVDLDAELQGRIERKDDDNVVAKEVNAAKPTVFNDEEVKMTMA